MSIRRFSPGPGLEVSLYDEGLCTAARASDVELTRFVDDDGVSPDNTSVSIYAEPEEGGINAVTGYAATSGRACAEFGWKDDDGRKVYVEIWFDTVEGINTAIRSLELAREAMERAKAGETTPLFVYG